MGCMRQSKMNSQSRRSIRINITTILDTYEPNELKTKKLLVNNNETEKNDIEDNEKISPKSRQSIIELIQLGLHCAVGSLESKPKNDLLMKDFYVTENLYFPPEGSSNTLAHHFKEFKFKVYASIAFRYFRSSYGIDASDFMLSTRVQPLQEVSNPGASGSILYFTDDDAFVIKTIQHRESKFLLTLLPGYYMNLNQNRCTLLPKFFGLYRLKYNGKKNHFTVLNNILPSDKKMHWKYDLKGSTYNRTASKAERSKKIPTYKDLDFMQHHPNGVFLQSNVYNALVKTIQRDCRLLESFELMDYSLLIGVHNLDLALKETILAGHQQNEASATCVDEFDFGDAPEADQFMTLTREHGATAITHNKTIGRKLLFTESKSNDDEEYEIDTVHGIPARNENGDRLLLFIGIIDILQSYRLEKKVEHAFKSIVQDGSTVSVCEPSFYSQRFIEFMAKTVFQKITNTLKLKKFM